MITLITGVPGSGKTLYAVSLLVGEYKDRPRFARVEDLVLPGVELAPDDWRETPDGSVVLYDEAQQIFPASSQRGVSADERIRAMEVHRHTGHDLIIVTQMPTLLSTGVRALVGRHIHVSRAFGTASAVLREWPHCETDPIRAKTKDNCDRYTWRYPRKLYGVYKSATIHTMKPRLPRRLALVAGVVVLLVVFIVSRGLPTFGGYAAHAAVSDEPITTAKKRTEQQPDVAEQAKDGSGIIWSRLEWYCAEPSVDCAPVLRCRYDLGDGVRHVDHNPETCRVIQRSLLAGR